MVVRGCDRANRLRRHPALRLFKARHPYLVVGQAKLVPGMVKLLIPRREGIAVIVYGELQSRAAREMSWLNVNGRLPAPGGREVTRMDDKPASAVVGAGPV